MAIRTKKEKKARLAEAYLRLAKLYPDAVCSLEYGGEPWRLLVMGRLSAQCTDARVNAVCKDLFAKYPTVADMAEAQIGELEALIRPCGLYKTKADSIKRASAMLLSDFGGEVPDNMEDLLKLAGVGRKIANLILGDVFGKDAIVCDTHCIRICGRLGMYPESLKDAVKIEFILRELMDAAEGSDFCHRVVLFGRDICTARSPSCDICPLFDICEHKRRGEK